MKNLEVIFSGLEEGIEINELKKRLDKVDNGVGNQIVILQEFPYYWDWTTVLMVGEKDE
jgi:hypothetical protein